MPDETLGDRVIGDLVTAFCDQLRAAVDAIDTRTAVESPIEVAFLLAIVGVCKLDLLHFHVALNGEDYERPNDVIAIYPQADIADFRCDFLLCLGDREIVVECDGHEFHERTPEQAERDRSRDRKLQTLGYTVMRFTGREIYREAVKHADDVLKFLRYGEAS